MKAFTVDYPSLQTEYPELDNSCAVLVIDVNEKSALQALGIVVKNQYVKPVYDGATLVTPGEFNPFDYITEIDLTQKSVTKYYHPASQ